MKKLMIKKNLSSLNNFDSANKPVMSQAVRFEKFKTSSVDLSASELEDIINSGVSIASILQSDTNCTTVLKAQALKQIARKRAEKGNWKESHHILENIYEAERKMHFCRRKGCSLIDLANTLYQIGVARNKLGNLDSALEALYESLNLRLQNPMNDDFGAVSTIHLIAMIKQKKNGTDIENEVYDLLLSQLNQHKRLSVDNHSVPFILKHFECALEGL